ncbi:hypothetical protein [Maricaulis maris]|uniref:hypothetical protein n=1 Tax=Maricaulis maris TaxID=74318 RepID=UPI003A933172
MVLDTPLILPQRVSVQIRPSALARGIAGHLMAAQNPEARSKFDDDWKACVVDRAAPLPAGYHIHYWVRVHKNGLVIRDAAFIHQNNPVMFSLLASSPIAFMIVYDKTFAGAPQLKFPLDMDVNAVIDLQIDPAFQPPSDWPWSPGETGVLFTGASFKNSRRFPTR